MLSATTNTTNTTANSETDSNDPRTKAELWNEVKMLSKSYLPPLIKIQYFKSTIHVAFTSTLTTLYSSLPANYNTTDSTCTRKMYFRRPPTRTPGKAAGMHARADGAGDGFG